jgi:glycine cleavage system regulatory protein
MVVLTLAGPDRPGLISLVSEQVAAHGGSWTESRVAHLAGQFAGIVLASLPDDRIEPLRAAFVGLGSHGLTATLHDAADTPPPAPEAAVSLSLVCQDRPGIIRDITRVLTALHVNIDELTTDVSSGSFSGEPMFHADARLRLPAGLAIGDVRADLQNLGNELMVDLQLSGASDTAAPVRAG